MEENTCYDIIKDKEMYYGHWIKCLQCGYIDNVKHAKYCGGCGKRLIIADIEYENDQEG